MTTTDQQFDSPEQVHEAYQQKVDRIRRSDRLAADAKVRELAQAHRAAMVLMGQLQEKQEADRARAVTGWKRRAFGSPGDDWAVGDAYRQAVERAERIPAEDLRREYDGAVELGDKLTARAIARRSAELGLDDVVTSFAELEPAAGQAARNLAQHLAATKRQGHLEGLRYQVPEPKELSRLSSGQRRAAAQLPGEADATREQEAQQLGDWLSSWLRPAAPDYAGK